MIGRILVCLDGSGSTETATRAAIALARTHRAQLLGIAIVDEPDIRAGTPTSIGGSSFKHERDEELLADARKQVNDWRALFERRCREGGAQTRTIEVVGRPADCILAEMENHDLVVLGREANFLFETEADGTGARSEILHRASRPVLLVPESAAELGQVVLIAFDGGDASKRAVASFAETGLAQGRKIHVATVDDNGERAWEMAQRAVGVLASRGIHSEPHNLVSTLPTATALLQLATQLGAGVIVMGAYARSFLAALFTGSVTRSLIEESNVPLFLQH
jgi:nucleotide-binding universal stress UspA family protein